MDRRRGNACCCPFPCRKRGCCGFGQDSGTLTDGTIEFINEIEAVAAAPVSLISASFDGRGPIDRRLW
jgi:hypothetical protein